jgi:HSP20 family protein
MAETTTETEQQAVVPARPVERRLRRWNLADVLEELEREMARGWGALPSFPRHWLAPLSRVGEPAAGWAPRLDVYEKDQTLHVKAELPGVKKEDISVSIEQDDLVIDGERRTESEVKDEQYYRMERSYGRFHRRVPLAFAVKPEQIKATYRDGMLEIEIPMPAQPKAEPKKIAIS